ncbi:protein BNIP5 [Dipodomys spectabilis]|uniref:protein BNIP5 n=1 Tax=Dipodomys spectabilis TaxID=105255 RepID=UPI001C54B908|nr:protein BNIP5 [Dipodomys spectabilis]
MEDRRGPRKSPAARRAGSLDGSQAPRRDSEAMACQCLSLRTTPRQRALRRVASDVARCSESLTLSAEAQGTVAAALAPEEMKELVAREQRPSEDSKKDKAQGWAQQGWMKSILNFLLLRTGSEEPKDKTHRKPKWKEEPTEPSEAAEDPALRKKAQDKKANRKKHRKHDFEETLGAPNQVARGHEVGVAVEADRGLACRGAQDSDGHQPLPIEGCSATLLDISPQASGPQPKEDPKKPDQDAVIWMIVELLKEVGDQLEEEQPQIPQLELAPQNRGPALRKKSQDKKSSLKKAFSLKKPGSEVPRRACPADTASPEARPPRRPSFLPLCVGGQRLSSSSSPDTEGPGVHEALCVDGEGPRAPELPCQHKHQGADEEPPLDRAAESREFMQKILALLQDAEELEGEQQPQAPEAELAVEKLAPACRKRSQEKKSSLRRAFSHKKHGSKEPKRGSAADTASPEARPPRRPSFLPLCVGGHRPSISSSSEELLICRLVVLLQEVDGQLGKQIRRHPSFKKFFHEFSDSSLKKLVTTLQRQQGRSSEGAGRVARPSPFAFDLMNQLTSHQSRTICSLMGSRGHCSGHNYAQFPTREAQPKITNLESIQSPD